MINFKVKTIKKAGVRNELNVLIKKACSQLNFERRMVDPITRGALALYIAKNNSKIRNLPILGINNGGSAPLSPPALHPWVDLKYLKNIYLPGKSSSRIGLQFLGTLNISNTVGLLFWG